MGRVNSNGHLEEKAGSWLIRFPLSIYSPPFPFSLVHWSSQYSGRDNSAIQWDTAAADRPSPVILDSSSSSFAAEGPSATVWMTAPLCFTSLKHELIVLSSPSVSSTISDPSVENFFLIT